MKRKGFTLVELLVVITIIALLMSILMPALARVRQMAYRTLCGTNLSAIGKLMLVYSNDNEEEYPIAGGRKSLWSTTGKIADAFGATPLEAFGGHVSNRVTVTSSFYLLIKYADGTEKQFVCKGDGAKVFKLSDFGTKVPDDFEIEDAWDFGIGKPYTEPGAYCSYAYHMPYYQKKDVPGFPIAVTSKPSSPLCADRNPYLDKNLSDEDLDGPEWDTTTDPPSYSAPDGKGNCAAHQRDGQNVLFNDSHVYFQQYPNCGINNDNIYLHWTEYDPDDERRQVGTEAGRPERNGDEYPWSEKDAYLVSERQIGL